MTNCPNCGAPLTGHKCEYCGAISVLACAREAAGMKRSRCTLRIILGKSGKKRRLKRVENSNRPTLGGYLELLVKVMVSMILLIFVGIGTAIVVLAVPFFLSFVCILALAAAGAFAFSWEYVWVGTIFFLILIGMAID